MKTQPTLTQRQRFKALSFVLFMMLTSLTFNSVYGQTANEVASSERTIKGAVTDGKTPLESVNVIQKGTRNGTVTNKAGEFTFPKKLKTGDVLIFSYLGYVDQEVEIKEDTTFITLELSEDLIEMIGALDTGKPYKSKRKN